MKKSLRFLPRRVIRDVEKEKRGRNKVKWILI